MNFVQVGWILVIISGVSSNNPSKPTFVTAGQSFKIAINETVTLPCEVKNLEYHKIAWRKRDEIISAQSLMLSPGFRFKLDGYKLAGYWTRWGDGVGQFKYVDKLEDAYNLIIENVQIEDAGEYTCQINTDPRNEITHTLEIEGPEKSPNPKPFFKTFGKKFKVAENDTIILPCEVKHLGNNVIAWHKGEDVISAGDVLVTPDDRIKLVDKFNLQIKNVQTEDSGVYHCQIGTKPRQEIKHTLKVFGTSNNEELPVPPKLFFPKIGQTFRMRVNSTVVLPCIAWNFYQGEFAWRKDEDIISVDCVMMSPNPRISVDHLAHFATQIGLTGVGAPGDGITPKSYPLKIENIQIEDSGDYSCQIGTNPRQEITYTLQVIETTLTSIGQNFTVKKGDTVVFPCEVKNIGDYIPHWGILPDNLRDVEGYELYAPNIVPRDTEMKLVNGFNLQIQNVTLDHDGVYYCQIPTSPPQEARYRLTVLRLGSSGDPCSQTYRGPKVFSEPEFKAISRYLKRAAKRMNNKIYLVYHSYGQSLEFPYGYTGKKAPFYNIWKRIAKKAAKAYTKVHKKKMKAVQMYEPNYIVSGGSTDWYYEKLNASISFLYEMRDEGKFKFILPPEQIIPVGQEHLASLRVILQEYQKLFGTGS